MDRWLGKVAVVTGASAGIGRATTIALVKQGLQVVGLARRVEKIEELQALLKGETGKLHSRRCDVANEQDLVEAFRWVKRELGGIDVLVNNAGLLRFATVTECPNEFFSSVLDVNVKATAIGIREAVRSMKERDVPGHIININGVAGHSNEASFSRIGLYSASKHAVTAITETVRKELAGPETQIKITSLSPGLVETEILKAAGLPNTERMYERNACLKSEDIADTIVYLLSTPPLVEICELTVRPLGEQ